MGTKDGVRFGNSAPTTCYMFDPFKLPIRLETTTDPNLIGVDDETKTLHKEYAHIEHEKAQKIEEDLPF